MKRDIIEHLKVWCNHINRKPMLLRGARQVGKSWLAAEFGKEFDHFATVNFERDASAKAFFEGDLHIPTILEKLSLYTRTKIEPGKTLLFLDEIQECERAITALRYFKEECPELHLLAAGSLVDFTLEKIGMPVGRIQSAHVYPLSFAEFLTVSDRDDLRQYLFKQIADNTLHQQLLDMLKNYLWLGGMPAVVSNWLEHHDPNLCLTIQDEIVQIYQQDFHKYARKNQIDHVNDIFASVPYQLGKKFKYTQVSQHTHSNVLSNSLKLLEKAGIIYRCYHSSGQGLPLSAGKNAKRFKIFLFDVGLAQRLLGLNLKQWVQEPINSQILGAIAEQFVAQEYIAYTSYTAPTQLYYWHREEKSSNAEVDFLFVKHDKIIPIEVKSSRKGGLKSMQLFLQTHHHSEYGVKISENNFSNLKNVEHIPLYALEAWLTE